MISIIFYSVKDKTIARATGWMIASWLDGVHRWNIKKIF